MTDPRLSTIYDFSDLRLHPDGTRVYQKSTNFAPRIAKVSVQNARSNWIARDAGGTWNVNLFRKKSKEIEQQEDEEEVIDLASESNGDDEKSLEEDTQASSGKKRKRPKKVDHRIAKRQKFLNNQDFLQSDEPLAEEVDEEALLQPEPSPELLKCLHRFASEFYTDRGQLMNVSKEYRRQRKERVLRKRKQQEKEDKEDRSISLSSSLTESGDSVEHASDGDSEQRDLSNSEENEIAKGKGEEKERVQDEAEPPGKMKQKGRKRAAKLYTDMYKVFDGSALMALGMLVQEQVAYLLEPQIPEGWEEEVRDSFTHANCSEELVHSSDHEELLEDGNARLEDEEEENDGTSNQENGEEDDDDGEEETQSEGGDDGEEEEKEQEEQEEEEEEEEEENVSANFEGEGEAENPNESTVKTPNLNAYAVHLQHSSKNVAQADRISQNTGSDNSLGDSETQTHSDEEDIANQDDDSNQSLHSSDSKESQEDSD